MCHETHVEVTVKSSGMGPLFLQGSPSNWQAHMASVFLFPCRVISLGLPEGFFSQPHDTLICLVLRKLFDLHRNVADGDRII